MMRSTRPWVTAGIRRRASSTGTSVPETAHLPEHRAALDRIHPDGGPLDGRRRRLEPREDDRDEADDEHAGNGERDAAQLLLARDRCGSLNIH